jgi:hypothetical protein
MSKINGNLCIYIYLNFFINMLSIDFVVKKNKPQIKTKQKMEKDKLKVKQISSTDIDDISRMFFNESYIQACFKKRLSFLNLKNVTIEGGGVTPQIKEVFETFWVLPLIHDVAACLCMYGFVQFKICKEKMISKFENELKKELNQNPKEVRIKNNEKEKRKKEEEEEEEDKGNNKNKEEEEENEQNKNFNVLVPRIILVPDKTGIYIENGLVKISALQEQDNVKSKSDIIHCVKNNLSVGPVYENGIICTEIGLLLETYRNLNELKSIHKQVRVDAAFPPIIIQKARITDFAHQIDIHSEQLEAENQVNVGWDKDGKIEERDKPPTLESCMTSEEVRNSIIKKDVKKPRYSIENQHFIPPGYIVVNNKSEPKLLFELRMEIKQAQDLTEHVFNMNTSSNKGTETKIQAKAEYEFNMKSMLEYKYQLEVVIRDIWIYVQKESSNVDLRIIIPLENIYSDEKILPID